MLRFTRNFDDVCQGQLCVVNFDESTQTHIKVHYPDNASQLNKRAIDDRTYREWKHKLMTKSPGFVIPFCQSLTRRCQFPLKNYVALTIHKLMGDTFNQLATSIKQGDTKYSIWLISQLYVILSRVHYLRSLTFVGLKSESLASIQKVLESVNLHESHVYEFFRRVKNSNAASGNVVEIPAPVFWKTQFDVPATPNGFVYVLVSMKDGCYQTVFCETCEESLSLSLRRHNSTEDTALPRQMQPWAMGFFFWNFSSSSERESCYHLLK